MESITELNGYILFNFNATSYFNDNLDNDNLDDDAVQPLWSIFLDRSQLFMVIIGVIANVGTSITLMKNGQVNMIIIYFIVKRYILLLDGHLRFSSDETLSQHPDSIHLLLPELYPISSLNFFGEKSVHVFNKIIFI